MTYQSLRGISALQCTINVAHFLINIKRMFGIKCWIYLIFGVALWMYRKYKFYFNTLRCLYRGVDYCDKVFFKMKCKKAQIRLWCWALKTDRYSPWTLGGKVKTIQTKLNKERLFYTMHSDRWQKINAFEFLWEKKHW